MFKKLLLATTFIFILTGCSVSTNSSESVEYTDLSDKVVKIPKNPQRIVTDYYVGQLLSINAPVIGADLTYTSDSWDEKIGEIKNIGQSVENVASLNPDLIITFDENKSQQYKTIAPTIYIPYGSYNEVELTKELSAITNKQDDFNLLLKDYESAVEKLESATSNFNQTVSIFETTSKDSDIYAYGNKFGRLGNVIYDDIDLQCSQKCEDTILKDQNSYILLTQEILSEYTSDYVIYSTPDAKPLENKLFDSPEFQKINPKIINVDSNLFYHTDLISQIDQINVLLSEINNE